MTQVRAVPPPPGVGDLLPGAQFSDAYQVEVAGRGLTAETAARAMLADSPAWVGQLMALRNLIVAPFGLKAARAGGGAGPAIGVFPIQSANPERVVLGFDDKHLDFRVVVDSAAAGAGSGGMVTATTLVRLHNGLGRAYLTLILPFHILIARTSLARVAKAQPHFE
jgi:hypothetical protein